jgi:glycosyltransferase involved in cell wall biosynthesis
VSEKLGCWICPHGGGRWRHNSEKWARPINSYSGWTRHTNTHISFGEAIKEEDKDFLRQYDYFLIFSTTGRAAKVVEKLRKWFPKKKIVTMTDGYIGDLCELKVPEPAILQALGKVDFILGNRPDAEEWVTRLCDVPYMWMGFPIELDAVDLAAEGVQRDPNQINAYHSWKAASFMRMIERGPWPGAKFVSFKNPANEFSSRRGWNEPDWAEPFGVHLESHGDTEWNEYLKVFASGHIGVALDITGQLGRFSTEMAALGIPCVGTNVIGRQEQLHRFTTVDTGPDMVGRALALVDRLKQDEGFWDVCSKDARTQVEKIYSVSACLERWAKFQERLWK